MACSFEAQLGCPLNSTLGVGLSRCLKCALHLGLWVCLKGAFEVDAVKGSMHAMLDTPNELSFYSIWLGIFITVC